MGQVAWSEQVYRHSEQRFQLALKRAEIKEGGARQGIDKKIQVAAFDIGSQQHGAKHSRVGRSEASHCFRDEVTMNIDCLGWFHLSILCIFLISPNE